MQQVPSLMYTYNPWSYLRYIFTALLATGSWTLFLLLDKERTVLEVCHASPPLLFNIAHVIIIYYLPGNTTQILELDAARREQKAPPVPGEKQHQG